MNSNNEYSNDGTSKNCPVSSIGVASASETILSPLSQEKNIPNKEQTLKEYNQQVEMQTEVMEANNTEVAILYEHKGKQNKSSAAAFNESSTKAFNQAEIDGEDPNSDSQLSEAIAAFIHCCGIPISTVDHPSFLEVLRLAKWTDNDYIPPDRKQISDLLGMTSEQNQKKQKEAM